MPRYVVLSRLSSEGRKKVKERMRYGSALAQEVEAAQGKVIEQYALLGEYDFCAVVELPNNAAAALVGPAHAGLRGVKRVILPAIDQKLFIRLCGQTTETSGPHRWQVWWPCRVIRRLAVPFVHRKFVKQYFDPFVVEGRDNVRGLSGPAIFIANHASHLDGAALTYAIPGRYRANAYWGSAADRWFIKGRKEYWKQGWWRSLMYGSFPIQRGGGSKTLEYAEWLIDRGGSIVIFPEGTRTTTGRLGKFRHGPSILALKKGVPVVPIFMDGLRNLLPKGSQAGRAGPVRVLIGNPIRFGADSEVPEATRTLYRAMEGLRRECRARRKGVESEPDSGGRDAA